MTGLEKLYVYSNSITGMLFNAALLPFLCARCLTDRHGVLLAQTVLTVPCLQEPCQQNGVHSLL